MTDTKDQEGTHPEETGHSNTGNNPAPSENEMPDPRQVGERVESGEGRRSAEEAFGEEKKS
jgi:hypothetical protein